jgi:hypothetical protein
LDISRRKDWDIKFHKGRVVKQISDNIDVRIASFDFSNHCFQIVHESYKAFNSPYKYRDFCLLRSWRKEADGGYVVVNRSVQHPDIPEEKDSVRSTMQASGFLLTPYTSQEEDGSTAFTLLLWIVQLDREGILIFTPDLLNETDELFRSFDNLRKTVFEQKTLDVTRKTTDSKKPADRKKSGTSPAKIKNLTGTTQ